MSAVPEEFMRQPSVEREPPRPDRASRHAGSEDSRTGWWQWLAIGVLLACWVAEATLCAPQGL